MDARGKEASRMVLVVQTELPTKHDCWRDLGRGGGEKEKKEKGTEKIRGGVCGMKFV